ARRFNSMKKSALLSSKSCLGDTKATNKHDDAEALAAIVRSISMKSGSSKQRMLAEDILRYGNVKVAAEVFTFRDLAAVTDNFNPELLSLTMIYAPLQTVAVKQLDRNGAQGNREFLAEVLTLSLVHHRNLVNLLGYCADGRQRILVYEYMSNGSLEDRLLGMALTQNFVGKKEISTPAYRRKFTMMADPLLEGKYPLKCLYQALAVAAMCLQEEASTRPLISDVVTALEYLAMESDERESATET
ncbi:hypothetical protein RJ639_045053, partial [Escallonia herrerae]